MIDRFLSVTLCLLFVSRASANLMNQVEAEMMKIHVVSLDYPDNPGFMEGIRATFDRVEKCWGLSDQKRIQVIGAIGSLARDSLQRSPEEVSKTAKILGKERLPGCSAIIHDLAWELFMETGIDVLDYEGIFGFEDPQREALIVKALKLFFYEFPNRPQPSWKDFFNLSSISIEELRAYVEAVEAIVRRNQHLMKVAGIPIFDHAFDFNVLDTYNAGFSGSFEWTSREERMKKLKEEKERVLTPFDVNSGIFLSILLNEPHFGESHTHNMRQKAHWMHKSRVKKQFLHRNSEDTCRFVSATCQEIFEADEALCIEIASKLQVLLDSGAEQPEAVITLAYRIPNIYKALPGEGASAELRLHLAIANIEAIFPRMDKVIGAASMKGESMSLIDKVRLTRTLMEFEDQFMKELLVPGELEAMEAILRARFVKPSRNAERRSGESLELNKYPFATAFWKGIFDRMLVTTTTSMPPVDSHIEKVDWVKGLRGHVARPLPLNKSYVSLHDRAIEWPVSGGLAPYLGKLLAMALDFVKK
jgi:hypothetical protein